MRKIQDVLYPAHVRPGDVRPPSERQQLSGHADRFPGEVIAGASAPARPYDVPVDRRGCTRTISHRFSKARGLRAGPVPSCICLDRDEVPGFRR